MSAENKFLVGSVITAGALIAGAIIFVNFYNREPQEVGLGQANLQPLGQESRGEKVNVGTGSLPALGDPKAPVTIVEFSDFQCPYCERFFSQTELQLRKNFVETGKAKIFYRDYPLPPEFHPNAQKAAEAARCANEQGKFWEYHDYIFNNQSDISVSALKQYAAALNLNTEKFNSCLDSGKYASAVQKDLQEGTALGVSGTPTSFINGKSIVGAVPYETFVQEIESALQSQ